MTTALRMETLQIECKIQQIINIMLLYTISTIGRISTINTAKNCDSKI